MTQLDSNVEEVTLQEIQLRKAFRSTQNFDQQVVYSCFLVHMSGAYTLDINSWSSSCYVSSQVVSRETMPKSMLEQYLACDKPPPLDKLNPYRWAFLCQLHILQQCLGSLFTLKSLFREDGKDGLKFYTDANYFFDLWRSEMLQSTEKASAKRGGLR